MTSAPLWSGLGLVAPLEARVSGSLPAAVTGISIDTRTLKPGDLFFAIRGDSLDGHDFVARAFENGAAAAVVDEAHARALAGSPCLLVVHDVLAALERLGAAARARSKARIIAVTGSVGKTSTKEALRHRHERSRRDPCLGRLLQQSLGRPADAVPFARECPVRGVRARHEPRGGDRARSPRRYGRTSP